MEKTRSQRLKKLTTCGMLLAIAVILGFLKVPINSFIEIRFAFLPIAMAGALFGPAYGLIIGALSDILGFIAKPTGPFFPGFTISSAIMGAIYGFFLFNFNQTKTDKGRGFMVKVIAAEFSVTLIVSLLLNSLWLSILYQNAFIPVFTGRLVKCLIMLPINIILLTVILKSLYSINKRLLPDT